RNLAPMTFILHEHPLSGRQNKTRPYHPVPAAAGDHALLYVPSQPLWPAHVHRLFLPGTVLSACGFPRPGWNRWNRPLLRLVLTFAKDCPATMPAVRPDVRYLALAAAV